MNFEEECSSSHEGYDMYIAEGKMEGTSLSTEEVNLLCRPPEKTCKL
jgi:hypothetical protein